MADLVVAENLPAQTDSFTEEASIVHEDLDIRVVARYPYQMKKCQDDLACWAERKIAACRDEVDDLQQNVEIAKKNKWGASALVRQLQRSVKRVEYYTKIKLALEAGHCIVPNFPVEMIAIRTKRKNPDQKLYQLDKTQDSQALPAGEGEWKNPDPDVRGVTLNKGEPNEERRWAADSFKDEIDFPFVMAKPEILDATQRAMADKFFDEIGVLPGRGRKTYAPIKGDPIVVGRIIDPRSTAYTNKFITFLIAWFIDTRDL